MGIFSNEKEEEQYELEQQLVQAERAIWTLEDKDCLNLLSPEQQISIIDNIIDKSIYTDVIKYSKSTVTNDITFENSNLVAQELALTNPDVARALFEELKYWKSKGQF